MNSKKEFVPKHKIANEKKNDLSSESFRLKTKLVKIEEASEKTIRLDLKKQFFLCIET